MAMTMRVGRGKAAPHILEQNRELGNHENQQQNHGHTGDEQQNGGVDQGGGDGLLKLGGALQVVGKADEDRLQGAAHLTGAYHVHIQARKLSVLLLQSGGEGGTAADPLLQVLKDAYDALLFCEVDQNLQGAVEGHSRIQQGRELAGEHADLFDGETAGAGAAQLVTQAARAPGLDRNQALSLEVTHHRGFVDRLQLALHRLPVRAHRLVAVQRHQASSATRMTSSTVVRPSSALRSPSSYMVSIPSATA